jgi:putative nucleotidyltransferase with HDIG domain
MDVEAIVALAGWVNARDDSTGGHAARVSRIAVAIARRLGYAGSELESIRIGALLHDLGKIGIPQRILRKPGPLSVEEWSVMQTHPLISHTMLAELDLPDAVCAIARHSHERIDGAGYPDRLAADGIPLEARIVSVADAFDALTSDRPYRAGCGTYEALEEVRRHSGTQFCPRVVAALDQVNLEMPELLAGEPARLVAVA